MLENENKETGKINMEQNEIIEIDENEEISNTQYDLNEVKSEDKNKKRKEKKPSKWNELPKKKKTIIILAVLAIILIIAGILLYFLVLKKPEKEPVDKDPIVIIEKDNYRYEDGKLIFTDELKKDLGKYECTNKDEDLCYVAYYSNEDDFDTDKKVYENGVPIDNRSDIINDKYVFVYDNAVKEGGKLSLYDIEKEEVIDTYNLVKEVSENIVIVKDTKDKYAVLDLSNGINEVIKSTYDYIGYILNSDSYVVSKNNNYQLIDLEGEPKSKTVPGEIKSFDSNSISVVKDKKYYVYNYDGTKKIDEGYDYIRFVGTYAIAASGKKLYVFDSDGDPMNIDGVRINSTNYNTKLIFNEDLRQIGKEVAFDAYITNENMRIENDNEYTTINLAEGKFNKTQEYINYFAGKLYFYSDSAKTKLIGSYPCNYANSVNAGTKTLENCFLAKESNIFKAIEEIDSGYLPIYNNRYIFIADTKSPNANDNIILWDLKNNKKLATYKAVDVGYHKNDNVVNFVDTAGEIALAKNTSDSYGLINIASSSVEGLIAFKDKETEAINVSVKSLKDYLLFKRSDDTYHLYDTKGNEITEKISTTNEIVDFNSKYIKVLTSNGNYLIYSLNGEIISEEFKYIIMENNYYITVDNNNLLGVYKYNEKKNLITDELNVDGKDYNSEIKYSQKGNELTISYIKSGVTKDVKINIE